MIENSSSNFNDTKLIQELSLFDAKNLLGLLKPICNIDRKLSDSEIDALLAKHALETIDENEKKILNSFSEQAKTIVDLMAECLKIPKEQRENNTNYNDFLDVRERLYENQDLFDVFTVQTQRIKKLKSISKTLEVLIHQNPNSYYLQNLNSIITAITQVFESNKIDPIFNNYKSWHGYADAENYCAEVFEFLETPSFSIQLKTQERLMEKKGIKASDFTAHKAPEEIAHCYRDGARSIPQIHFQTFSSTLNKEIKNLLWDKKKNRPITAEGHVGGYVDEIKSNEKDEYFSSVIGNIAKELRGSKKNAECLFFWGMSTEGYQSIPGSFLTRNPIPKSELVALAQAKLLYTATHANQNLPVDPNNIKMEQGNDAAISTAAHMCSNMAKTSGQTIHNEIFGNVPYFFPVESSLIKTGGRLTAENNHPIYFYKLKTRIEDGAATDYILKVIPINIEISNLIIDPEVFPNLNRIFDELCNPALIVNRRNYKLKKVENFLNYLNDEFEKLDYSTESKITTINNLLMFFSNKQKVNFREINKKIEALILILSSKNIFKKSSKSKEKALTTLIAFSTALRSVKYFESQSNNINNNSNNNNSTSEIHSKDKGKKIVLEHDDQTIITNNKDNKEKFEQCDVLIIGADFDGCLYHGEESVAAVVAANGVLLNHVSKDAQGNGCIAIKYTSTSKRNDATIDKRNQDRYEKANFYSFSIYEALSEETQRRFPAKNEKTNEFLKEVTTNQFWLADVWGNRAKGDAFKNIDDENYQHPKWVVDESKVTLVWPKLHEEKSSVLPNQKVIFDFWDDNPLEAKIFATVKTIFTLFPEFIPKGVVLRLKQYDGKEVKLIDRIEGIGEFDEDFSTSVKYWATIIGVDLYGQLDQHGVLDYSKLLKFKYYLENKAERPALLKERTNEILGEFKEHKRLYETELRNFLDAKASKFEISEIKNQVKSVYTEITHLFDLLKNALEHSKNNPQPILIDILKLTNFLKATKEVAVSWANRTLDEEKNARNSMDFLGQSRLLLDHQYTIDCCKLPPETIQSLKGGYEALGHQMEEFQMLIASAPRPFKLSLSTKTWCEVFTPPGYSYADNTYYGESIKSDAQRNEIFAKYENSLDGKVSLFFGSSLITESQLPTWGKATLIAIFSPYFLLRGLLNLPSLILEYSSHHLAEFCKVKSQHPEASIRWKVGHYFLRGLYFAVLPVTSPLVSAKTAWVAGRDAGNWVEKKILSLNPDDRWLQAAAKILGGLTRVLVTAILDFSSVAISSAFYTAIYGLAAPFIAILAAALGISAIVGGISAVVWGTPVLNFISQIPVVGPAISKGLSVVVEYITPALKTTQNAVGLAGGYIFRLDLDVIIKDIAKSLILVIRNKIHHFFSYLFHDAEPKNTPEPRNNAGPSTVLNDAVLSTLQASSDANSSNAHTTMHTEKSIIHEDQIQNITSPTSTGATPTPIPVAGEGTLPTPSPQPNQ